MIYIITHKEYKFPNNAFYQPLVVGANNNLLYSNYLKDNTNTNISLKNSNYCELTGLYWIWKNVKDNIVGLVHYRRYFFKNRFSKNYDNVLNEYQIKDYLKNNDIILPNKKYLIDGDVYSDYVSHHVKDDLDKCISIIEEKYPDYKDSINRVLNRKYLYSYNMFIANKELINDYCEWLFDVLFELEKRIDINNYDSYNKRIYGFLAERLFNIWIDYKELKINEICVNNVEENVVREKCINIIKYIFISFPFRIITKRIMTNFRKKGSVGK